MTKKEGIDLQNRIRNLHKRWDIASSVSEQHQQFINRILAITDKILGLYILNTPEVSKRYLFILGRNSLPSAQIAGGVVFPDTDIRFQDDPVYITLSEAIHFTDFIAALQYLFWVLEEHECPHLHEFANGVQETIDFTSNINLRIAQKNNAVTIYPAGAKILDEKLVNETLVWLENKPSVSKYYEQALSIYLSKDKSKYRNLLDNLRMSLEQLLRVILNNNKSLEKQQNSLLPWLKNHGIHKQIINMYNDILARFTQYQNDAVKHGDSWSNNEIEFLIYLTGAFMRLLLNLDKD